MDSIFGTFLRRVPTTGAGAVFFRTPPPTIGMTAFLAGSLRSFNFLEITLVQHDNSTVVSTLSSSELAIHSSATGSATATFLLSNTGVLEGTLLSLCNSLSLISLINSLSLFSLCTTLSLFPLCNSLLLSNSLSLLPLFNSPSLLPLCKSLSLFALGNCSLTKLPSLAGLILLLSILKLLSLPA